MSVTVLSKITNLTRELCAILPAIRFQEVADAEQCKLSEIIIADFDLLSPHVYKLPNTKWVQGTWAGVDKILPYINSNTPLPFTLTRFSGVHFGKIMSEYVITNIVNNERDFYQCTRNKVEKEWNRDGKIGNYRIISDLTIGILGVGSIGDHIGKMLNMLGAKVLGYRRSPEITANCTKSHFEKYYTLPKLSELLQLSDYIVNVLPHTPETQGLLNNNMLKYCHASVFINIGRGSIISEEELIKSINEGWLSAAILDVFNTEPLPKESPLWSMEKVTITPHVAGLSRAKDIAEQFKINYDLYLQNLSLPCQVEPGKMY